MRIIEKLTSTFFTQDPTPPHADSPEQSYLQRGLNYLYENKIKIVALTIIALSAAYHFFIPDADEVLAPECNVVYQTPSTTLLGSALQSTKEYAVLTHMSGSKLTASVLEFVIPLLSFFNSEGNWGELLNAFQSTSLKLAEFDSLQSQQITFDHRLNKTLSRSYQIIPNPWQSSNFSVILQNRFGYNVAILKKVEWRERFVREFNPDGHLLIPAIQTITLPGYEQLMAIEFMQGAKNRYSRTLRDDYGTEKFYESLSTSDLYHAISQRQRIFIIDILTQNNDRHGYGILVGCRDGHVALHPIDHDCTMVTFRHRIDTTLNPFMRSTFSPANRDYINSLSFAEIDQIAAKYEQEINSEAFWLHDGLFTEKTVTRIEGMKIISVLLKIAVEKQLSMAQLSHLFPGSFSPIRWASINPKTDFLLGTEHESSQGELLIRKWVDEQKFIEKIKVDNPRKAIDKY